ncbi:MAG TPA: hypothetical protein VIE65_12480 [Methylobacter sp.]|jgi:hypothetical protein
MAKIYEMDGIDRQATVADLKPGLILRHGTRYSCFLPAFSDCIVTKIEGDKIHLVRPYVYVHLTGTTSPSPLFGSESFYIFVSQLDRFIVVMLSTGEPQCYNLDRHDV